MAFTKHSPLVPVFKLGWSRFWENGHLHYAYKYSKLKGKIFELLRRTWEGDEDALSTDSENGKVSLSAGQVIVIFVIMGTAVVATISTFIVELVLHQIANHYSREERSKGEKL